MESVATRALVWDYSLDFEWGLLSDRVSVVMLVLESVCKLGVWLAVWLVAWLGKELGREWDSKLGEVSD